MLIVHLLYFLFVFGHYAAHFPHPTHQPKTRRPLSFFLFFSSFDYDDSCFSETGIFFHICESPLLFVVLAPRLPVGGGRSWSGGFDVIITHRSSFSVFFLGGKWRNRGARATSSGFYTRTKLPSTPSKTLFRARIYVITPHPPPKHFLFYYDVISIRSNSE